MNWIIDTLKRFTAWLETRNQPKPDLSVFVRRTELEMAEDALRTSLDHDRQEIEKLKKTVENLSLLTGLHRGIKTPGGR